MVGLGKPCFLSLLASSCAPFIRQGRERPGARAGLADFISGEHWTNHGTDRADICSVRTWLGWCNPLHVAGVWAEFGECACMLLGIGPYLVLCGVLRVALSWLLAVVQAWRSRLSVQLPGAVSLAAARARVCPPPASAAGPLPRHPPGAAVLLRR